MLGRREGGDGELDLVIFIEGGDENGRGEVAGGKVGFGNIVRRRDGCLLAGWFRTKASTLVKKCP